MLKQITFVLLIFGFWLHLPQANAAPFSPMEEGFSAKSFVVMDEQGKVIAQKNEDIQIPTASMMKLLTVLTAQRNKADWNKVVKIEKADQVGGGMLGTRVGTKYKCLDLLHSTLILSTNNTASALWKCTKLSKASFIAKGSQLAKSLGAKNTEYVELSGLDPRDVSTAGDFVKISNAALSDSLISKILKKSSYSFSSSSNPKRYHTVKNSNGLLGDKDFESITGKTGYIEESGYNFAGKILQKDNKTYTFVIMGNPTRFDQISNTRILAVWAGAQ